MPWICESCGQEGRDDDLACAGCGVAKTSWTMVPDQTRAFVVSQRAKLEILRGTEEGTWVDADYAPAITKAEARQLVEENRLPRIRDQFKLRIWVGPQDEPLGVQLGVGFVSQELAEHSYQRPQAVDTPFLLVYGEGETPSFEGLEVVDVTEDTDAGHAPQIEVAAAKGRPRELPVQTREAAPTALMQTAAPEESEETPALPVLRIIELEDVSFHNDSAVLLPASEGGTGEQAQQTGLSVMRAVLQFVERFPHMTLLVAGHTDSVGSVEFNRKLSVLRAANAAAFLRGDRQAWAENADGRHEVEDWQRILTWLAQTRGWSCDPGGVDNKAGPKSRAGLDAFRSSYADSFGQSAGSGGAPTTADWAAFYDCYDDALAGLLECSRADLATYRERLRFHPKGSVGCGEAWPVEAAGIDGHACQANRRVELLFFEESEIPALAGHTADGYDPEQCDLYGAGRYTAEYIPVDLEGYTPADHLILRLPIWDREGNPLTGLAVEVEAAGRTLSFSTDAEGIAEILLPRPAPAFVDLTWNHGGPRRQRFTIDRSEFGSDAGQEQELQNLFFHAPGLRRDLERHLELDQGMDGLFGAARYREAMQRAISLLNEEVR